MEDVEIISENLEITETTKTYLMDQVHAVFGYDVYKIKKIKIKILENEKSLNNTRVICRLNIYLDSHSIVPAEIKSLDVRSAISLAVGSVRISRFNAVLVMRELIVNKQFRAATSITN